MKKKKNQKELQEKLNKEDKCCYYELEEIDSGEIKMLTREEAYRLHDNIVNRWGNKMDCLLDLHGMIGEFTENPKREIQVGDIYRNLEGTIQEITSVKERWVSSSNSSYYLDGSFKNPVDYEEHDYSRLNLDLSKRYKLVEIEE